MCIANERLAQRVDGGEERNRHDAQSRKEAQHVPRGHRRAPLPEHSDPAQIERRDDAEREQLDWVEGPIPHQEHQPIGGGSRKPTGRLS